MWISALQRGPGLRYHVSLYEDLIGVYSESSPKPGPVFPLFLLTHSPAPGPVPGSQLEISAYPGPEWKHLSPPRAAAPASQIPEAPNHLQRTGQTWRLESSKRL